jgi:hypothetical protein
MADKIVQCGYMSGDTYSAAALLAADPGMRIILVKDTKGAGQYADKSELIGKSDRVHVLDVSGLAITAVALWKSVSDAYKSSHPLPDAKSSDSLVVLHRRLCNDYAPARRWPRSVTAVTGLLANRWEADPRGTMAAVAKAWKIGTLPTAQKFALYEFMGSKFAKTGFDIRKNIVVLWSRQSGKRGGAHLELDSSYQGIRQLAHHFADVSKRATVLLAGDERNLKMKNFAATRGQVIDVTQMWDAPIWKEQFGDAKFLAQFAFFKYLADDYKVIHVGMRSGLLEAMALLNMRTFYLEDLGSESGSRMVAFRSAGITYHRIQIAASPGITGRIVQKNPALTKELVDSKLEKSSEYHKGRQAFQTRFGDAGAWTDWAATGYAKANLLGYKIDDRDYNGPNPFLPLGRDLEAERGFRPSDLENIVKLVEGAFV